MRAARESGESSSSSGGSDRGRDDTTQRLNEAMTAPALVPGFGSEAPVLPPVLGFGPSAELMSVEVTPADLKEAEDRLERYDRDKNGFLAGDELSSRWSGNPLDFDRNGDGKLSVSELAVRAARMRVAQVEVAQSQSRKESDKRGTRAAKPAEIPDPYKGRKSFATLSRKLPEGLPGWFAEKDVDSDQQISMAEFSKSWTDSLVAEFQGFDLNGDGFVTAQECLAAVRDGASASTAGGAVAMSSGASSTGASSGSSRSGGTPSTSTPAASSSAASATPAAGQPDQKTLDYVQKIIGRNDKNKDGQLSADEWKDMLVDPSAADTNKDGRITALEYAQWIQSRQAK
jgi:Ca2+-binding EF-hand superfamily protein